MIMGGRGRGVVGDDDVEAILVVVVLVVVVVEDGNGMVEESRFWWRWRWVEDGAWCTNNTRASSSLHPARASAPKVREERERHTTLSSLSHLEGFSWCRDKVPLSS